MHKRWVLLLFAMPLLLAPFSMFSFCFRLVLDGRCCRVDVGGCRLLSVHTGKYREKRQALVFFGPNPEKRRSPNRNVCFPAHG